ncbi:hypothetical protein [Acinetobacter sp. ME22]|nr:hypothetical protein [Acinetobacter sp. ME22]
MNGLPIDFKITRGEDRISQLVEQLIGEMGQAEYLIANKGYDS